MKSQIFTIILLCKMLAYLSTPITEEYEISRLYDDMINNKQQNKLRRYMIFEIDEKEISNPEHFSRIIVDFFTSNNFNNGVYNVKNKFYLVYLSKSDDIKIQTIRDYFGKAFKRIFWFNRKVPDHDFRKAALSIA